jgi:hypothetical protein
MPDEDRVIGTVRKMNRLGWTGDIAVGSAAALVVGLLVYLFAPGPSVYGVPASMVWAGTAFVAGFSASMTLYSME